MRTTTLLILLIAILTTTRISAERLSVSSPDGLLTVGIEDNEGSVSYSVSYDGETFLLPSALGIETNVGDYLGELTYLSKEMKQINEVISMRGTKASTSHYVANQLNVGYANPKGQKITITFNVSDNDIALRYSFDQQGDTACIIIKKEATSFRFPEETTTFICPQSDAMIGWKRTKPSYEEEYKPDAPMTDKSKYGEGYTFPCLFHIGDKGWVLVSETGTDGSYPGTHLGDYDPEKGYSIAFPMEGEANGWGSSEAALALPGHTPWRTITIGKTLKPIAETTISYDVVEEKYEASEDYKPGRYTWSWLIWQDNSINFEDQVKFIDLAGEMGYEYVLVDGCWDVNIGRERIAELSQYAQEKGASLMLWYNSNGFENDAPQTPKNCMNTSIARKKEMAWMRSIGIKGIKVDFFAGDKQHTMLLYEDILSDANDYGLQVIFHGCTLPRGWEKMFPNYVASEAVLASENVYFSKHHAEREAFELTMHPFCRNAVASMDWGGTIMNKYMSRDNKRRHYRRTSDTFEMAAAIINQSSIQCIAIQPNNLAELPDFEIDFLKNVPSAWEETRLIDGYPGKYVIMARKSGGKWFVAGLNATDKEISISADLSFIGSETKLDYYYDEPKKEGELWPESKLGKIQTDKQSKATITIQPNGGIILK